MNRKEFENSLQNVMEYWAEKSGNEVTRLLGEAAGRMVGYDQENPHHCYTLFEHCMRSAAVLNDAYMNLKIAAFFHDIGKPEVAMRKKDRKVFFNHAQKSAEIMKKWLAEHEYSEEEINEICFYIKHHDDFIQFQFPHEMNRINPFWKEINEENVMSHIREASLKEGMIPGVDTDKRWKNLFALCQADIMSQAEYVYQKGVIVDSREHKLDKLRTIAKIVEDAPK